MNQSSRAFLKIRLNRWSLLGVLALSLAYYSLLFNLRPSAPPAEAKVYLTREARAIGQTQLRSHAAAWEERQRLSPSIRSLEQIKHPSAQQQRELQQLKKRQRLLSNIEDHELRLSLRGADSSVNLAPTRKKLEELRRTVEATAATE